MSTHRVHARAPRGVPVALERVTDAATLALHCEDAAHVPGGHAAELAVPRSEREVADLLRSSQRVLTIGAQSSLTGGATPRGETLLSTSRLRSLEVLDEGHVRVAAGLTVAQLDLALRARGLHYPPGPTWQGATLGGTIATNAAGAATFKYGTTRAWVDALTVVLASGDVLDLRRGETRTHPDGYFELVLERGTVQVPIPRYRLPDVPKVSAGYYAAPGMDLVDLFIGSEGTLGVVTEATVRVNPRRPATCLVFATFRGRSAALACVRAIREEAMAAWRGEPGADVSAIEHMDARSLQIVREDGVDRALGVTLDSQAAMGLLVVVDLPPGTTTTDAYEALGGASRPGSPAAGLGRLARLLETYGANDDVLIAAPGQAAEAERLLALREAVPVGVNRRVGDARRTIDPRIEKTAADTIVPFAHVEAMLDRYDRELRERGLDGAVWGHISDGNVHPNIVPASFADVVSGREAVRAFGLEAIRLGGSPMAEHGVGRNPTKQQLLVDLYGHEAIADMRRVKRALDPGGKLAPGVIFPAEDGA